MFRQKILGRLEFIDCPWLEIAGIDMKEKMIRAVLSVQGITGHLEVVDHLPKAQARRVYRIGQEMEEAKSESRRKRRMEEDKNAASQVTINTMLGSPFAASDPAAIDLVARLQRLKQMFESGLISEAEFQAKKTEIIDTI